MRVPLLTQPSEHRSVSTAKLWCARIGLFCLPFLVVLGVEGILRLFDVAKAPSFLEEGPAGAWSPASDSPWGDLRVRFGDWSIRSQRGERELCLALVGASTVRGFPFDPSLSFGTWLEAGLQLALPSYEITVLCCGENGKNAFDLVPLVEALCDLRPDAILVYSGHNETHLANLADFSQPFARDLLAWTKTNHLGRWLTRTTDSAPASASPSTFASVLSAPVITAAMRREATSLHRRSLQQMVTMAAAHNIPIFVSKLVANEKDYPPAGSLILNAAAGKSALDLECKARKLLAEDRGLAIDDLWFDEGAIESIPPEEFRSPALEAAEKLVQQALELCPENARFHFLLARIQAGLGLSQRSVKSYQQAFDLDAYPMRASAAIQESVCSVVADSNAILIDPDPWFRESEPDGLIGAATMIDYVHPNLHGQYRLAQSFFAAIQQAAEFIPASAWQRTELPTEEECRRQLQAVWNPNAAAARVANLGFESLTAFAARGIDTRPSVGRSFATAIALDPDLADAQLGLRLVSYLADPSPRHEPALVNALRTSSRLREMVAMQRRHTEWEQALTPILAQLRPNRE